MAEFKTKFNKEANDKLKEIYGKMLQDMMIGIKVSGLG